MSYSLTGLADTDIQQNKPIKATQGQQIRDNLIAVAAGSLGAPKVVGQALDLSITTFSFTSTAGGITDIDARAKSLLFLIGAQFEENTASPTATVTIQMRASSDNGSTWGPYGTIVNHTLEQNSISETHPTAILDTETGIVNASGVLAVNLGKTSINAVQLRTVGGDITTGRAIVSVIGGIA